MAAVPAEQILNDVLSVLECDREEKEITFTLSVGGIQTVRADADMFRQVLFNLLLNAIEAVPQNGHIEISLTRTGPQTAQLDLSDDGPGVAEPLRDTLFQPYVTGTASGTGLGLTIVRQIALAHGWTISFHPRTGGGTVFRLSGLECT